MSSAPGDAQQQYSSRVMAETAAESRGRIYTVAMEGVCGDGSGGGVGRL